MSWLSDGYEIVKDISGSKSDGDKQRDYDFAMWQLNNEYNTPANQVARLRAAGLNPNLFYDKGSVGNSSSYPTYGAVERQNSFQNVLSLVSTLVGLQKQIADSKRSDRALDLQERAQDLDSLKFQSALAHQQDAMDLERKRMAVDLAFKNSELSRKDRDYELRKAQFEWSKTRPYGGVSGYIDKLITATLGRSPTDVATDTGNFLNYAVAKILDNVLVKPAGLYNTLKYSNFDLGSGMSKIRY